MFLWCRNSIQLPKEIFFMTSSLSSTFSMVVESFSYVVDVFKFILYRQLLSLANVSNSSCLTEGAKLIKNKVNWHKKKVNKESFYERHIFLKKLSLAIFHERKNCASKQRFLYPKMCNKPNIRPSCDSDLKILPNYQLMHSLPREDPIGDSNVARVDNISNRKEKKVNRFVQRILLG